MHSFVGLTAPWAVDLRSIEELHTALDAGIETWKPNCTGLCKLCRPKTRAVSGWQGLEAREVGSPNSWSSEIKPSPVFLKMLQLALDEFWTLANVQEFRNDQK